MTGITSYYTPKNMGQAPDVLYYLSTSLIMIFMFSYNRHTPDCNRPHSTNNQDDPPQLMEMNHHKDGGLPQRLVGSMINHQKSPSPHPG